MSVGFTNPINIYQVPTLGGLFNYDPKSLLHWRKAINGVRNGTSRAKLLILGDSTSCGSGAGSGGTGNMNNAFTKSWCQFLVNSLSTFLPTSSKSLIADQNCLNVPIAYPTFDPRVTMGANWSIASSLQAIAANAFQYTTGAANNFSFAPGGNIDTAIVYTTGVNGASLGTMTTNVDGGASLGTIDQNVGFKLNANTYTFARGVHTINIVPGNNGNLFLGGIYAYDSTVPAVDILQGGYYGALASAFTTSGSPWFPSTAVPILAPDLTLICLDINDSNTSGLAGLPAYLVTMQSIITFCKTSGDVILMTGPPSNTVNATNGTLAAYQAGLRQLCLTNNCAMIDIVQRLGSYALVNAVMPYFDTIHPGAAIYQDMAAVVADALRAQY